MTASLGTAPLPPVGLYVHIPFCVSICPYCDFVVVAGSESRGPRNRIDAFVGALLVELDLRADALDAKFGRPGRRAAGRRPALGSLYLGGGTPSLLGPDALGTIVERVRRRYGLAPDAEVTLEANPGPDERGDPLAQRELGVTRVSFGAQSFNAAELSQLGRRHSPADIADAVGAARAAGIGSINIDLLYDIPGQTLAIWMDSLERAIVLGPDHLSLYALTLDDPDAEGLTGPGGDHLPTTVGARRWRQRGRPLQDDDRAAGMYHFAWHRLAESRFRGYELSNWARPGHEGRHNLAYWERRPVEAVGPGAHAFDGAVRRWSAARLDAYVDALRPGPDRSPTLPPGAEEPALSQDAATAESIILGLRLDAGVPLIAFLEPPFDAALAWADESGLVEQTADGRVRLTTNGRLLSNEFFARLV
ncbi:MAG: coproporphyrinogen III oxidase family protein [Chloroflexota bacterium]|nr:coproporphyrinogen III oxidase family protein [Chloroflexota bacterium]